MGGVEGLFWGRRIWRRRKGGEAHDSESFISEERNSCGNDIDISPQCI